MTEAERDLLARARTGQVPSAAEVCATIASAAELDGYEAALRASGQMDGAALQAVEARRRQIGRRG